MRTNGSARLNSFLALKKELESEREKFKKLFNLMADPVIIVDGKGNFIEISDKVKEITGYEKEDLLKKNFLRTNIVSAKSKVILTKNLAKRMIGINIAPYEIEVLKKNGEKGIAEINAVKIEYEGKSADLVVLHDITERKKLEETLSELNFYGGKLNTASTLQQVYELTLDAMRHTLGFENASFMIVEGGSLRIVCTRGYPEPLSLRLPLNGRGITVKAVNARKPLLILDVGNDKDYVEGVLGIKSELAVPVETEDSVLGVLNVESRKLGAFTEKDVTLLQILASHAATAIGNLEKRGEIENRSSQLVQLLNCSAEMIRSVDMRQRLEKITEAIRAMGWRRVVLYVTDYNLEIRRQEDIVTAGLTPEEKEFLWAKRQPGQVWRQRFGPEFKRFRIGEFYYFPWSDPWVRKNFSVDLVPSKLPLKEMVDWDPQDLLCAPLRLAEGRIVGMLSIDDPVDGRRPTEESLAPFQLFLHQAAVAIENAKLFSELNDAKNQIKEYADQLELKVKQRTLELMEAQKKLLKAERMAAIGELAAMVGHDLRNPLAGIDGAAYYLKTKIGSKMDERTMEMFEIIEKDIGYSNNIITDLLEYSREIRLEIEVTDPKSMVTEALSLIRFPQNILVSDLTMDEPRIEVDSERMKRVFVNIIKNAIEAMPEGGKLTIATNELNGNLEIAFADTGIGMSKETLDKLWTPLFTTKAKGMGLGLSICKRFVEAHGGSISVKSKVGKGTTFTVKVPVQSKLEGGESTWIDPQESLLSTTMKP